MSDSRTLPRPPQATMAGWVTIVGSVLVVIGMFDGVAKLRSLETQERVERLLKEPPFSGTDLRVDDWLSVMNVAYVVAAACGAATAILGWYALQRDRRARLALSILVVPLFLTGLFSGSFTTSVVTVAVVMLWMKPARDWFAGRVAAPPVARQRDVHAATSASEAPPTGPPVPGLPRPSFVTARPDAVMVACLVTWVVCGLALMLTLVGTISLLADASMMDTLRDRMETQRGSESLPSSDAELRNLLIASMAFMGAYCLIAMVLALFTFLRRNWARVALIANAGVSALFCLATASTLVPLVPLAACLTTIYLLLKPEVREWFAAR